MKSFMVLSAFVALCTLSGCRHHEVIVERVEPVEPEPDVVVIQEGEPCDGMVYAEPPVVDEYVFIGGRYCYWHPGYHRWVQMHHGFRPGRGYRVRHLNSWHDRPMHAGDVHRQPGRPGDAHRQPGKTPDVRHQPGKTEDVHHQPGKTPDVRHQPGKTPPSTKDPHAGPTGGHSPTKNPPDKKPSKEDDHK